MEKFLHGCFSRFLNCTNGTKSRNAPHITFLFDLRLPIRVHILKAQYCNINLHLVGFLTGHIQFGGHCYIQQYKLQNWRLMYRVLHPS